MEQQITYTQEQLNVVAQSYMDEIIRLTQIKANHSLQILRLRNDLLKKDNELRILKSNKIDQISFIKRYQKKSNLTDEEMNKLLETNEVLPCDCGEKSCEGWKIKLKKEMT